MLFPIIATLSMVLGATAEAEYVDHPIYKSWAQFKPGTVTTTKSVTIQEGKRIDAIITHKLVERTDEKVVIEMIFANDATGKMEENSAQKLTYNRKFPLFPGVKREEIGKPMGVLEDGEETLKIGAKEYKTHWYDTKAKVEAGDILTRAWMSDEVPGQLIKTVHKVPKADKVTTVTLVEIKTP